MPTTKTEIRAGAYYDSIVLMQLQRALIDLPGVEDAGVVMGTPANKALLEEGGLLPPEAQQARPDDLILVVKAESEQAAQAALAQVDDLIAARRSTASSQTFRPRSLESAAKALPQADLVLVSVPGRYAAGVARQALELGKHVFLYSDNVSLEDEIALKQTAREQGLLVMGPDCGTAIVHGVGLGFANRVRRGPIGLVAAAGTGLQAVSAAIHNLGSGVSQAIGTGGRDLKAEVGGITALQGLALLAADPDTQVIVLVSKPPAPPVAARLLAAAQTCGKPVVVNFIGYPPPARRLGNVWFAVNLQETAEISVQCAEDSSQYSVDSSQYSGDSGQYSGDGGQRSLNTDHRLTEHWLRGLFSGGTLALEAVLALQNVLHPLYTNVPITAEQRLDNPFQSRAHTIVDLGEDAFTQGRLHPMLDNDLRIRRLRQEATDPAVGVILLDVVLGEGAHPDPAGELAPVIRQIIAERKTKSEERNIEVYAIVIGTEDDPQDLNDQVSKLEEAGAKVFPNIPAAVAHLLSRSPAPTPPPSPLPTIHAPLTAINVGLESFFDSLTAQGAKAVHVEWRPPAGGDERLAGILARLSKLGN